MSRAQEYRLGEESIVAEVIDGHLRLKAAAKLRIAEIAVILCDEWTPAQVKAFRLLVNRSVNWASWDEELLALELKDLSDFKFDLTLTGFDTHEIDGLLAVHDADGAANAVPPLPVVPVSKTGDLWVCGDHRVLCGDSTSKDDIARLLGDRQQSQPVWLFRFLHFIQYKSLRRPTAA